MYFSQNLDNIWTTSIKNLSKGLWHITDIALKSKYFIYLIISVLPNTTTTSKVADSFGKRSNLPNPNRITKQKPEVFDYQRLLVFFIVFLARCHQLLSAISTHNLIIIIKTLLDVTLKSI